MRHRGIVAVVVVCLAGAAPARAQVSTSPVQVATVDTHAPIERLDELTKAYNLGNWNVVQAEAAAILRSTSVKVATDYAIVCWIAVDSLGKPMIARVIVHDPIPAEPFSPDLPGAGVPPNGAAVYEVFLSRRSQAALKSVYTSARDKDPAAEQLPAFAQALTTALLTSAGAFAGIVRTAATPEKPPGIQASVARVNLPFERATVKWKASAKEPIALEEFAALADAFARVLRFEQPGSSVCARAGITALQAAVTSAAAAPQCLGTSSTLADCVALFDGAITSTIDEVRATRTCTGASRPDLGDLEQAEKKTREFVRTNLTSTAEADVTFKNRPLTHWSFGAGSAVLVNASLTLPRVSVKDEALVADPLGRVVTLAYANWSPGGYDTEREPLGITERMRPLFGVTLTPDFGVAAGVNVLLARGIGVMAAGVVMFAKGAVAGDIGAPPKDPNLPYRISYARGWVLGASYNFK